MQKLRTRAEQKDTDGWTGRGQIKQMVGSGKNRENHHLLGSDLEALAEKGLIEKLEHYLIALSTVAIGLTGLSVASMLSGHERVITVDSKERQCDAIDPHGQPHCYYVVFSREGEIYENTDVWYRGKWSSGSLQARLQVGQKYRVKLLGWRVPVLSWKENILSAEPI
jgi:hypothetical protein